MDHVCWEQTLRKYFDEEPARLCYVEGDIGVAGSPLWPFEPSFNPKKINQNIEKAREILKKLGGHLFSAHVELDPDRRTDPKGQPLCKEPKSLSTVFASGFLVPEKSIQTSRIGFYKKGDIFPPLKEVVAPLKGTWLVTNLGYFLTKKLIAKNGKGGLVYAHNTRHPADEHLAHDDNNYLGGFFVRQNGKSIAYPPHFGTAGVAITKQGKPVLVDHIQLKGGELRLGSVTVAWNKTTLNPEVVGTQPFVIYTPSFTNQKTLKTIDTKDWREYRQRLGENRVNVIIINKGTGEHPAPYIAYIKEGKVLQPAAGILVSFSIDFFNKNFSQGAKSLLKNRWDVAFEFEPWFDEKLWKNTDSFYEGLIVFTPEGRPEFKDWCHPNSILTQETFIPNDRRREPRAVLIKTKNYFGGFVFSGRYEFSIGISFLEIAPLLKKIIGEVVPEETIEKIVGLDSGSGAKLCMVQNGELLPLYWAAPGPRSRMGDPNGNTYSLLHLNLSP